MNDAPTTYRRLRLLVIAAADLAALAEIVVAMYRAAHTRGDLTSVFVSGYFSLFLPTVFLAVALLVILRLWFGKAVRAAARSAEAAPDEGGLAV